MKNSEIFDDPVFQFPIKRDDKDLLEFVNENLENYQQLIQKFDSSINKEIDKSRELISNVCKKIIESIEYYYKGNLSKSYSSLSDCLSSIKDHLWIQKVDIPDTTPLYRVRLGTNKLFEKKDLFHIPFEKREKVRSHRFSIPGLPSLYLSDSVYVCWEELKRPNISEMHISRFDISKSDFRFLFLNQDSTMIKLTCFKEKDGDEVFQHEDYFIKYLVTFPLQFCCNVRVSDPILPFKSEYIIPQMVLQWVVNEVDLDGIKYFSNWVRVGKEPINFGTFTNTVIPVKSTSKKGYCTILAEKISLTNPISWQLLEITDPRFKFLEKKKQQKESGKRINMSAIVITLLNNAPTLYSETAFGILEAKLKNMKVDKVNKST